MASRYAKSAPLLPVHEKPLTTHNRFGNTNPRNSLFAGYDAATGGASGPRTHSASPRPGGGYGYTPDPYTNRSSSAYGHSGREQLFAGANGHAVNGGASKLRSATPNKKGQYSDAVLNELEGQNNEQFEGMSAKVQMLKQVRDDLRVLFGDFTLTYRKLTNAIGDEIRDSTAFTEKMNDSFANTRVRLQGTMNRMLRMAEKTGVGWKVWLGFFAFIVLLFWYVRLS